ncbi:MAG TPA: NBR1-Ig-like domain-containing protein [Anaerolineales bacterium]|jgi:hypothetical protein
MYSRKIGRPATARMLRANAIVVLLAISLSACNIGATPAPTVDVNAIYTSAAETALADLSQKLTQTAQAASPTPLPTNTSLPTNTPFATLALATPFGGGTPLAGITPLATPVGTLSGPLCNDSAFIADVTIPDGTQMNPGQDFEKIWAIQNSGTCTWDEGYMLVFASGDDLDGYTIEIKKAADFVDPGETINFKMNLTASLQKREYTGCWRMKDDGGYFFGTYLCVNIVVQ